MRKKPKAAKPPAKPGKASAPHKKPVPARKPAAGVSGGGGGKPVAGKLPAHPFPAGKPPAKAPVKRKLALGEAVACCAAEALAASLRLTGWPVTDAEVVNLYRFTARDDDEGATILATLRAASEFGLAGKKPRWAPLLHSFGADGFVGADRRAIFAEAETFLRAADEAEHALILGVDLPGPHAVYDDGTAWWSWGEPWDPADFPLAVIEEMWEVSW